MIFRPSSTSRLLGLSALTLLSTSALAQTPLPSYYYGGVSVGQSQTRMDEGALTRHQLGAATGITATNSDERDTAYKVFLGYQFNRYLALEGGYFDLGEGSFTTDTTTPLGSLSGKLKTRGWSLDLVGSLPVTPKFSVLGRIGAQHGRTKAEYSGTGLAVPAFPSDSKTQTNYKYGAGLQYELTPSVLVRGEWERYRVSNVADGRHAVNVASVSLVFPFGRAMQPAPRQEVAAAPYVAPPPAPMPAPVVVPAEPVPQRVSFSAESLFGFDKEQIRPEGQRDLDTFTQSLQGTQYDTIQITGHTDRLGSSEYNQRLSERRAMAVKNYLVTVRGLEASRITATGLGETQPVTRAEDCVGERRTAALVACLQPDRRVDVDVKGTR
jgi:OOP family OmpA-OmpF porin